MAKLRSEPGGGFLPTRKKAATLLTPLESRVLEAIQAACNRTEQWVYLRDLFETIPERRTAFRFMSNDVLKTFGLECDWLWKRVRNPNVGVNRNAKED